MKNAYIGLMVEDTESLLVGILGILKSGNCLVPINPRFPADRVGFIVGDCQVKILLTDRANYARAQQVKETCTWLEHVICIDGIDLSKGIPPGKTGEIPGPTPMLPRHQQPCYVIYTSGSTGKPKGVTITYENLMPLLLWFHEFFGLGSHTRVLQNLSYTFDFGFFELVTTLLTGGVLYFFDKQAMSDANEYVDFIFRHQIDTIHTTPSFFINIIGLSRELSPVKLLHFGGERLTGKIVREVSGKIGNPGYIYNGYGPTETTINSAIYAIRVEETGRVRVPDNIPIGKPSANNTIFICDAYGNLQPPGVTGELYIGGGSVSQGYINRPELTREKFIFHRTYRTNKTYISKKVYKTGDLGRWLPGGDIEFLGRVDHQVKIRGFRIELGEIESRLLKCKGITDAVVIDIDWDPGGGGEDKYLCAYVVSEHPGNKAEIGELREELDADLPDYMVPGYFVFLDKIPLTPNGKVDRRNLPLPGYGEEVGTAGQRKKAVPPQNYFQETLLRLWREILPLENFPADLLGIDDSFFHFGGDSLKAVLLVSKVHKAFDVKMPLWEVFRRPTTREMARYIENAGKEWFVSIEAREKKEYYHLSSAQKRLSFLQQLDPQGIGYNMPMAFELTGEVDKDKLADTFRQLIRRHESLRTSFPVIEGETVQRIHDEIEFHLDLQDLQDYHDFLRDFIRPFDLSRAPLLRVGLAELQTTSSAPGSHPSQEGRSILMIDMHHIISDAVSLDIFTRDFMALYAGEVLPGLRIDYKDYSQWQHQEKYKNKIRSQEDFWVGEFKEEIFVLDLPIDFPRPKLQSFAGRHLCFQLDEAKTRALKKLTTAADATLYMLLITLFNILLAKITGQEDIVLGSPLAGRRHVDLEQIIGMFVNTLALRNHPTGEKTFTEFLKEVRQRILTALENQDYQFEDLVEKLVINRDLSRNPLFDVMLVLQNASISKIHIPGLELSPYQYEAGISKFDLIFNCEELEDRLVFTVEFSTKLFLEITVQRFINYFKKIVDGVSNNKDIRIWEIEIVSGEERKQLLYDFNNTAGEYPTDQLIHQLFETRAERIPDNIAIVGPDPGVGTRFIASDPVKQNVHLTYNRLNKESDQLAHRLREKGVKPGTIVGLLLERSPAMIAGILAVLKAGGAYLPIDPDYPQERIDYMLKDSSARIILKKSEIRNPKSETNTNDSNSNEQNKSAEVTVLNFEHSNFEFVSDFGFRISNLCPSNLAYIIYTSGSSGSPKGVLVEHSSVVNLAYSQKTRFEINENDRVLQFSTICFDASVEQIFITLSSGAVLVLIDKNTLLDPGGFDVFMSRSSITHIHAVPSFLSNMKLTAATISTLKRVIAGGDVCPKDLARTWSQYCDFYNEYGPTETTVTSIELLVQTVEEGLPRLPIGKPVNNTTVYLLDRWMKVVPLGAVGELYLGGKGVARGYLNQPELTAEKFDQDLWDLQDYRDFQKKETWKKAPGKKDYTSYRSHRSYIYRTGDLARWLPDGNIDFLGRIDRQVKIRGYRIELPEIENQLLKHGGIKEAALLVKEKAGDNYLAAYIVSNNRGDISAPQLREYLSGVLPEYMIPSYFIEIDEMPLGTSGKIDRHALPEPELKTGQIYTAPRDKIEQELTAIWTRVLSLSNTPVGIDDNFFQLGGHSLKAAMLAEKIYKVFNIRLPLQETFERPTIRSIARYIKEAVKEEYLSIEAVEEKEYYLLSSPQKRLYLLHQADKKATVYNMPTPVTLEGKIEKEKLENVFKQLIRRHESFRTSFVPVKGEPVQRIHEVEFEIEYFKLKQVEVEEVMEEGRVEERSLLDCQGRGEVSSPDEIEMIIREFIRPFDLSRAPLLRVGLIELDPTPAAPRSHPSREGKSILMVDMHHIISDGMSTGILVREFMTLLAGEKLMPVEIRYKDFSQWWNQEKGRETLKQEEAFWIKEFETEIPVLKLQTDYPRPGERSFAGSTVDFDLGQEETAALNQVAKEEGTTLFMVLLALYNALLARLTGQEDIVVGTPVTGRYREEFFHTIGMFVNTIVLRNFPKAAYTFREFLRELKEHTLNAFENQNYPFEELVEKVVMQQDNTRNPLFDVMFTLQNNDIPGVRLPHLTLKPYSYKHHISKFDLNLIAIEKTGILFFTIEYSSKLFKAATIERFIRYFKDIVCAVLENRDVKLSDMEISLEISTVEPTTLQEAQGNFGF